MFDPNDRYAFSASEDEGDDNGDDDVPLNPVAEALFDRCTDLLEEVEAFQRALLRNKLEKTVELRLFVNQVKAEYRSIQGLVLESPDSSKSKHAARACNLPYLEAVWRNAKSTTGITALSKKFTFTEEDAAVPREEETSDGRTPRRRRKKKTSVTVDIVGQNGLQWIKISLLTPRRLLFELAKAGWEEDPGSLSSSSSPDSPQLATTSLPLTTLASNLIKAASQIRVQYLHPHVHFIFPNLPSTPQTPELTAFLTTLTDLGVTTHCGSILTPPRSVPELVTSLTTPLAKRPEGKPLSNPLNIDTTILLALISDVSHTPHIPVEPRFHPSILKQLEQEREAPMLETFLLPVLANRTLLCASSARDRFNEIVAIIASDTERARWLLLLDNAAEGGMSAEDRIRKFQELSAYPVGMLKLPVETVADYNPADRGEGEEEEEVFTRVSKKLSVFNRGAFMTGWKRGLTTVTSNRAVAKMVEGCVGAQETGPDVWVVDAARSLVGKAKRIEDVA